MPKPLKRNHSFFFFLTSFKPFFRVLFTSISVGFYGNSNFVLEQGMNLLNNDRIAVFISFFKRGILSFHIVYFRLFSRLFGRGTSGSLRVPFECSLQSWMLLWGGMRFPFIHFTSGTDTCDFFFTSDCLLTYSLPVNQLNLATHIQRNCNLSTQQ